MAGGACKKKTGIGDGGRGSVEVGWNPRCSLHTEQQQAESRGERAAAGRTLTDGLVLWAPPEAILDRIRSTARATGHSPQVLGDGPATQGG